MKKNKFIAAVLLLFAVSACFGFVSAPTVKWVDFNASEWALRECLRYEQKFHGGDSGYDFSDAVAYLALKNGNRFSVKNDKKTLSGRVKRLESGEKMKDIFPESDYAD